jgi:iron(III) transport system permease protein
VTAWRWGLGLVLTLGVGLPLLPPFLGLTHAAAWQWAPEDRLRVLLLAGNSLLLAGGTLLLAVPAGVLLAVLLFRGSLPGRRATLALLLLSLFVPVPIVVSSWQALLGQHGWLPLGLWRAASVRPWATGWGPALWVQGLAGLPWIVFIVGLGLRWVEPELEEEALQQVSARRTFKRLTLPRCRPALVAAMLLVALCTVNDISVTGMMQIPTLAEEADTQFTLGNDDALARSLLLSMPALLSLWVVLMVATAWLERALPPLPMLLQAPPALVRPSRGLGLLVFAAVLAVVLVPLQGLLWRLGQAGRPPSWSLAALWPPLANEAVLYGAPLVQTFAAALCTGIGTAGLALVCCWLALDCRPLQVFLLALLTFAWALPGPVVGIGLKQTILALVSFLPEGPWTDLLYRGPSPVPVMWAQLIRFLPVALFFLWPVVRLLPRELREAARLEGGAPLSELLHLVWPLTRQAVLVTAVAVTALCLGEVGAGGRVETPNGEPFAALILDRMHYGIDSNVAALCVLYLGGLVSVGLAAALVFYGRARWCKPAAPSEPAL